MKKLLAILAIIAVLIGALSVTSFAAEVASSGTVASGTEPEAETPEETAKEKALGFLEELYNAIPEEDRAKYSAAALSVAEMFADAEADTPAEAIYNFLTNYTAVSVVLGVLVIGCLALAAYAIKAKMTAKIMTGSVDDLRKNTIAKMSDVVSSLSDRWNDVEKIIPAMNEIITDSSADRAKLQEAEERTAKLCAELQAEREKNASLIAAVGEIYAAQEKSVSTLLEKSRLALATREEIAEASHEAQKAWKKAVSADAENG